LVVFAGKGAVAVQDAAFFFVALIMRSYWRQVPTLKVEARRSEDSSRLFRK
jgi:hypothetical protein